jgi:hypothetical protein
MVVVRFYVVVVVVVADATTQGEVTRRLGRKKIQALCRE